MLALLARAVATVRAHAAAWHVDEKSVGLLGCSAGAHLCATYTPPTFHWHLDVDATRWLA